MYNYNCDFIINSPEELSPEELDIIQDKWIEIVEYHELYTGGGIRPYIKLDEFLDKTWLVISGIDILIKRLKSWLHYVV